MGFVVQVVFSIESESVRVASVLWRKQTFDQWLESGSPAPAKAVP